MPFKSEVQRRKFYAMKGRGEISAKTVKEWEDATPDNKKLPERVNKKASALEVAYKSGQNKALAKLGLGR